MIGVAVVAAVAAVSACGPTANQAQGPSPATVMRVIDGDTVDARLADGREVTARLSGIDTPETQRPGVTVERGGEQASVAMRRLVEGQAVTPVSDATQDAVDRFGRSLFYVDRSSDGLDVGEEMLRCGWAEEPPGCLGAVLGGEQWPGGCWRPFADASPFNTPLPANPRLAPDSDAVVRRMLAMVGGRGPTELEAFEDGRGGEPTYCSRPSDPVYTVHCTRDWGRCAAEGVQVRIPAGAVPEGNRGSSGSDSGEDAHLTVVDLQAGREVDLWQVQHDQVPAAGGRLNVSWGGVTELAGHGIEVPSAATAAEFANLAGRVRAEELEAGAIDHAIFVVVKCDSGRWVFPARKAGGRCENPADAPPMGARLRLDYTDAEIDALAVPRWKKPLLRAMARYGLIVGDTGTNDLFSIERESGLQYRAMGRRDRWLAYAREHGFERWSGDGGVYIGDVAAGVDWRRLQVVHPCVSQRTC